MTSEGIETARHAALARELGCARGQGYHFARPLPPDEVETYLAGAARAAEEAWVAR